MRLHDSPHKIGADIWRRKQWSYLNFSWVGTRTQNGHGQTVVAENSYSWSWKNRGKFLATADTGVAILWTFPVVAGKLPGCCADATPDATPDAARTATSIAKSSANHRANIGANLGADIHRRLVRCFPPTARTRLGSCPDDSTDVARMIRRTLPGCCADCGGNCEVICQPSCELWRGHSPALGEMFPANCWDMSRLLPG